MKGTGGESTKGPVKGYPTIGACGLDCGLCPRYYTVGTSRCPGCAGPGFADKHPSCAFITCCVKKRGLEVCGQCPQFPCSRFRTEGEYMRVEESPSYPSYKKVMPNLRTVKELGIEQFASRQKERMGLLRTMIAEYDDGRSRSFFCKAACLLDPATVKDSVKRAAGEIERDKIGRDDRKSRARILRAILDESAQRGS